MSDLRNRSHGPLYRTLGRIASAVCEVNDGREELRARVSARAVVRDNGCWTAAGGEIEAYPKISINNKKFLLSRVSFRAFNGPLPDDVIVRQICDNSRCFNPAHLVDGTHQDNANDKKERNRNVCNPPRGILHHRAKLTDEIVMQIRGRVGTNAAIAVDFGVSESLVQQIRTHKIWRHVGDKSGSSEPLVVSPVAQSSYIIITRNPANGRLVVIVDSNDSNDPPLSEYQSHDEAERAASTIPICVAWGFEIIAVSL